MRTAAVAFLVALAVTGAAAQLFEPRSTDQLPYPTDVFEPAIDNETMTIHWTRHANAFVTNLNNASAACPVLGQLGLTELNRIVGRRCLDDDDTACLPVNCTTVARNSGGGLWNHGLFFLYNLAPAGSQSFDADASPELQQAVWDTFGSLEAFQQQFIAAANAVFGSGWAWLVTDKSGALRILTTPNQDNPLMDLPDTERGLPILGLDVWEHAHYIKYRNLRANYTAGFPAVINWKGVSEVYAAATAGTYNTLDVLAPAAHWTGDAGSSWSGGAGSWSGDDDNDDGKDDDGSWTGDDNSDDGSWTGDDNSDDGTSTGDDNSDDQDDDVAFRSATSSSRRSGSGWEKHH